MPEPETLMSILLIRGPEQHDRLTSPPPLRPSVLGTRIGATTLETGVPEERFVVMAWVCT